MYLVQRMDLELEGKAALVTASSKGIGFGVAKVLASEGCKVAICSRSTNSITRAKDQIVRETGNREVDAVSAAVTAREDIERLAKNAVEKLGGVGVRGVRPGHATPGAFVG